MRESFGTRLRKIRKQKGLPQGKLAEKIGIPQTLVSRYEKGTHLPSLTTFEWLCDALGVTATELLGY